jgi:histidyl-tRNA synthetase
MALAVSGLQKAGAHNWRLMVGHVQLMRLSLEQFGLDSRTQRFILNHIAALADPALGKSYVLESLDRLLRGTQHTDHNGIAYPDDELNTQKMLDVLLDATQRGETMGGRDRTDIVRRLLKKRQRATEREQYTAALDFLETWSAIEGTPAEAFPRIERLLSPGNTTMHALLHEWRQSVALLDAYDIPQSQKHIQPALARNWDYYTGLVFELSVAGRSIGGGGRYDELARLVGGEYDVPAVGFACDGDVLLSALSTYETAPSTLLTITAESGAEAVAVRWAHSLRALGWCVSLQAIGAQYTATLDGKLRRGERIYSGIEDLTPELSR